MAGSGLPEGYEWRRSGAWRIALRTDHREVLEAAGIGDPEALARSGTRAFEGRGRPVRVLLPGGGAGVLRRYLHGGLLRSLTGRFFAGPSRPLRELRATVRAERAGVRVPEVLAALHRRRLLLWHEGWILTREAVGALDLVAVLRGGAHGGDLLRRAGEETRRMHDAGVRHADLHVKNVLCRDGEVMLIDFDGARIRPRLSSRRRLADLLRFDRSVEKLARSGPRVTRADRWRFFCGYHGGRPARDAARRIVRRCRRTRWWHRLWWRGPESPGRMSGE